MNRNQKQIKVLNIPFSTQKEAREYAKEHNFTVKEIVRNEYSYILKYTEKELKHYVVLVQYNAIGEKVYYAGKKGNKFTIDLKKVKTFKSEFDARRAINYEQGWFIEDIEKWV